MVFLWGIEVQAPLLFFAMAIVLSGVLISSRFSLLAVAISSSILSIFYYLQQKNILHPSLGWKNDPWGWIEITVVSVIFFIIAIVSWLSNREIEKSLERARKSESDLKKERDQLEIKVEARTKELKEMQAEKMSQVYRLAELGRLSSGLFHDLMNPLNAVHLNIEGARNQDSCNDSMLSETKAYLDRAMSAAKKMEDFIKAVRKQIIKQDDKAVFSPIEEIKQVIEVLLYKARKAKVELNFSYPEDVQILGNATKFNQVALNLISNAIESYANLPESSAEKQSVSVSLREEDNNILMSVEDHGEGILKKNLGKIFEPFFTTKGSLGMGIGLSTVKKIVQDDFGGKIEVESKKNKGTIFKIVIPKK
jgi:signal transduction histidine kinase